MANAIEAEFSALPAGAELSVHRYVSARLLGSELPAALRTARRWTEVLAWAGLATAVGAPALMVLMVTVAWPVTALLDSEVTATVTVAVPEPVICAFSGNSELPNAGTGKDAMVCPDPFRVAVTGPVVWVMVAV